MYRTDLVGGTAVPGRGVRPHGYLPLVARLVAVAACAVMAGADQVKIGDKAVVPEHSRSLYNRFVNWRPGAAETVSLNPPRLSWPYSADSPKPWRTAQHEFTLQISAHDDCQAPLINVRTRLNFYNTLPAFTPDRTWYWRVGYDVGTEREKWSPIRSFTVSPDAVTWDRAHLASARDLPPSHPRILFTPETLPRMQALAQTDDGSRACLAAMRKSADSALEADWWRDFPDTDRGESPTRPFYAIAHDLATVCFVWRMTGDAKYSGVKQRAVTWASYPSGGRSSPEGLGGDGNEDATQGNEFLALLFDWLYEDLSEDERRVMIRSLEWRVDHVMNRFSWGTKGGGIGPMVRLTFRPETGAADPKQEGRDQRLKLPRSDPWRPFQWRVNVPPWATQVHVEPFNYYAPGEASWDSITVSRRPGGPNLLANGDFADVERGVPAGWIASTYRTDATLRAVPGAGTGGTGVATISNPDGTDRGAWQQRLDLNGETELHISGSYRTSGGPSGIPVSSNGLAGMTASHPYEAAMDTAVCGVALLGHSTLGREWFEVMLNYLIGVTCGHGFDEAWNEGAGYGSSKCKWLVNATMYFDTALPEANLGKNPVYSRVGEFLRRVIPVGMPHHAWGNQRNSSRWNHISHFRKLAYLTGDGQFMLNWRQYGGKKFSSFRPWIEYVLPGHYVEPEPVAEADAVGIFPIAGWAMAASGPPSLRSTYDDGLGVIFQCRTRGGYSHSFYSDSSFQLHAYGQMLNHGGGSSANQDAYAYHSMSHNLILIDGLGQAQPAGVQEASTYGRIVGHARGSGYVYFAGDATRCYPRKPGNYRRWGLPMGEIYTKRALPYLRRAVRHILFVKESYFVIYDDVASTKPATFTWLYHILPDTGVRIMPERSAVDYSVGDVNVRLQHVADSGSLLLADRPGEGALVNPMTGEDYRQWRKGDILCGHNLWISNREQASQWRFLAVVYPTKPGTGTRPEIRGLDADTVAVGGDVICFNPDSPHAPGADILVDPRSFRPPAANAAPLETPQ